VQIIGVAENAQIFGPDEVSFDLLYVPFAQHPVPSAYVLVASDLPRAGLAGAIRATAYALDKDQPVFDMETMDDRIANRCKARVSTCSWSELSLPCSDSRVPLNVRHRCLFCPAAHAGIGIRLALGARPPAYCATQSPSRS